MSRITETELQAAMAAAGATGWEISAEIQRLGLDALLGWANGDPGCVDPVEDGGWHWTFAEEVAGALWGSPDER